MATAKKLPEGLPEQPPKLTIESYIPVFAENVGDTGRYTTEFIIQSDWGTCGVGNNAT